MSVLAFASVAPAPVAARAVDDHFIRIAGQPVRVRITADGQGHRLAVGGVCPTCGKDTDWFVESVSPEQAVVICRSCDQGWPIEFGAGAEFKIASFDNPGFTEAFRKMLTWVHIIKLEKPEFIFANYALALSMERPVLIVERMECY